LRTKRQAVEAIDESGGADVFRLVHDTFHHHLAGETELFPERTGIVHISGVVDPAVAVDEMLDPHRVLVDHVDRLENVSQIRALLARGFQGPYSFEPFAPEVHQLADLGSALRASMDYVAAQV
jgi:2-keto-myo-inositol isomerase